MIALVVVAVLTAIVVGPNLRSSGPSDSKIATPAGPPPKIKPIHSYRATYVSDSRAGGPSIFTTEEDFVRRPFDSVNRSWTGTGSTKKLSSEIRTTMGSQRTVYGNGKPFVLTVPPGAPPGDMRLDVVLDDLVRRGVVVVGKSKVVNGRRCVILKTKDPIVGSVLEPPNASDHTDNCVESHGIVVEERWWLSKKLTRIRTLIHLDLHPTSTDADFQGTGTTVPLPKGGALIQKAAFPLAEELHLDVPSRFTLVGHDDYFVGQAPQGQTPQEPLIRALSIWTDGDDFITLEQGQVSADGGGLPTSMGIVTVPNLETAGLSVTIYGSEVFGNYDSSTRLLRLRSSLSPEDLLAVAKTLHRAPSASSTTTTAK